jgi:predicted nucleic acid-binding protein
VILVDTSVWVDHLRKGDAALARLLTNGEVLVHPFITGELSLGVLRQRQVVLTALNDLPQAKSATEQEVLHFIEENTLPGSGIGYVDAHVLAATKLTPGTTLWTRDKRLLEVAQRLGLAPKSSEPAPD